jgi:hypothetical protein
VTKGLATREAIGTNSSFSGHDSLVNVGSDVGSVVV